MTRACWRTSQYSRGTLKETHSENKGEQTPTLNECDCMQGCCRAPPVLPPGTGCVVHSAAPSTSWGFQPPLTLHFLLPTSVHHVPSLVGPAFQMTDYDWMHSFPSHCLFYWMTTDRGQVSPLGTLPPTVLCSSSSTAGVISICTLTQSSWCAPCPGLKGQLCPDPTCCSNSEVQPNLTKAQFSLFWTSQNLPSSLRAEPVTFYSTLKLVGIY